jgi:plasminogen activator inhibitor 1 RNA-binding protein
MATRNPFGQLRVDREDDEDVTQVGAKSATVTPLFTIPQASEQKKKKKVRPDEKKRSEEPVHIQESNEGFEVVGGKQKPRTNQRSNNNASEEGEENVEGKVRKDRHQNKQSGGHGHNNGPRPAKDGKRQFDRHSGTGRGKEVAKNGAGGKTVWGDNPEYVAKQAKEEYSRDDHCKIIII